MLQPPSHLQSMNPLTTTVSSSSSTASSAMSATATPFYPTSDTVESVIGRCGLLQGLLILCDMNAFCKI